MPTKATPYIRPARQEPSGNWLQRGLTAVVLEQRLPHQIALRVDRLCTRLGIRRKTIRADGLRFRVRRLTCDEDFVQNVVLDRDYTPPRFEVGESNVVIDIGGNIGTFALHAARSAPRGRVFVFEPSGENFALLLENIALNRAANITPVHAAVSGSRGEVKLFTSARGGGFHSLEQDRVPDADGCVSVPAVALRDIFDDYRIDRCHLLKLDCEGSEYEILHSLPDAYFARIDKIVMEYHVNGPADADSGHPQVDRLVAHFEELGFDIDTYWAFVGSRCGFIRARRVAGRSAQVSRRET